jgi:uncharacterized protein YciI
MPLFALYCVDKPNSLEIRMGAREKHLAYLKDFDVKLGGPLLDDAGNMVGSTLILEVADLAAAKAFAENDPYNRAGLFESVRLTGFRTTVGGFA